MSLAFPDFDTFQRLAASGHGTVIPVYRRLLSDQLTPVLAYRRRVRQDERMAPSYLFESVIGGDRIGRYSYLRSQPIAELIARGYEVEYRDRRENSASRSFHCDDPLGELIKLTVLPYEDLIAAPDGKTLCAIALYDRMCGPRPPPQ